MGSKEKIAEDFSDFGESDDEILNQAGFPNQRNDASYYTYYSLFIFFI